jgi:hypothetical protein
MKALYIKKKRFVTLLETLIAMSLLSMLLIIIFGFFKEMSAISQMTEEKQKEAFKLRYVESRLTFVFECIVNENASDRRFFFYCEPNSDTISKFPSLIMTYNNETRADPDFSGDVLARIYVDDNDNLCLLTWPLFFDKQQPLEPQQEVLCKNVSNLAFKFYAAPQRLNSKNFIDPGKIDPNKPERDRWYENEWLKVFDEMPSIIQIHLEVKDHKIDSQSNKKSKNESQTKWEFAFVLPSSKYPLYYPPS